MHAITPFVNLLDRPRAISSKQVNHQRSQPTVEQGRTDKHLMKNRIQRLVTEDSGQDLIEYAIMVGLLGLGTMGAMRGLSNSVGKTFNSVSNGLTNAVS